MQDNLDEEQKGHLIIEDNKRKKVKRVNLNVSEKEQLRKYKKKEERKLCVITLR